MSVKWEHEADCIINALAPSSAGGQEMAGSAGGALQMCHDTKKIPLYVNLDRKNDHPAVIDIYPPY